MSQSSERRKLRSNGRPVLELIDKMVRCRRLLGGEATWTHVKSHVDGSASVRTINETGNSVADYMAKHPNLSSMKPLPLHLGEHWFGLLDANGTWISNLGFHLLNLVKCSGYQKWSG